MPVQPQQGHADVPAMDLNRERQTYQRALPGLMDREGEFVLIHGDDVVGTYQQSVDAFREGYRRYKAAPFLVHQVRAVEPVYHVLRAGF